jgi:hypothetical protein
MFNTQNKSGISKHPCIILYIILNDIFHDLKHAYSRANCAERRSGREPGARVLIPTGYLHPGKGKN